MKRSNNTRKQAPRLASAKMRLKTSLIAGVAGLTILGGCGQSDSNHLSENAKAEQRQEAMLRADGGISDHMKPGEALPMGQALLKDKKRLQRLATGSSEIPAILLTTQQLGAQRMTAKGVSHKPTAVNNFLIPTMAFVTESGKPYVGRYEVEILQILAKRKENGQVVGQAEVPVLEIRAKGKHGETLKLSPGKAITAQVAMIDPADCSRLKLFTGVQMNNGQMAWSEQDITQSIEPNVVITQLPKIHRPQQVARIAQAAKVAQMQRVYQLEAPTALVNARSEGPATAQPRYIFADMNGELQTLFSGLPLEMATADGKVVPAMQIEANRTGYIWVDTVLFELQVYSNGQLRERLRPIATRSQIQAIAPGTWGEIAALRPTLTQRQQQRQMKFESWLVFQAPEKKAYFEQDANNLRAWATDHLDDQAQDLRFKIPTMRWANLSQFGTRNDDLQVRLQLPNGQTPDMVRRQMINKDLKVNAVSVMEPKGTDHMPFLRDDKTVISFIAVDNGKLYRADCQSKDLQIGSPNTIRLKPIQM